MPAEPQDQQRDIELPGGATLRLRPVRNSDKAPLRDLVEQMSSEDVRMRFHEYKETLSDSMAESLTDIDYGREMVFVLTEPDPSGVTEIFGAVQIVADPKGELGEYAVMVRSDMQGLGLGRRLMEHVIEFSRGRGIKEIIGYVLRENGSMLRLCDELGFTKQTSPNDPALIEVQLKL
jgi:acetyltransferase